MLPCDVYVVDKKPPLSLSLSLIFIQIKQRHHLLFWKCHHLRWHWRHSIPSSSPSLMNHILCLLNIWYILYFHLFIYWYLDYTHTMPPKMVACIVVESLSILEKLHLRGYVIVLLFMFLLIFNKYCLPLFSVEYNVFIVYYLSLLI